MEIFPPYLDEQSDYFQVLKHLSDSNKNLVVIVFQDTPVLLNKAFLEFANVTDPKHFLREFGSLSNRFVPHPDYFHRGKVADETKWLETLITLPIEERIVSMINFRAEPFAFEVEAVSPLPELFILTFKDITQDLIKRIMTQNEGNIDPETGAYTHSYFIHTAKSLHEAALLNKKMIGLILIDTGADNYELKEMAQYFKKTIRQSDMLIRWGKNKFIIAFLIDNPDNISIVLQKVRQSPHYFKKITTVLKETNESITAFIHRIEIAMKD